MAEELEILSGAAALPSFWSEIQKDYRAGTANLFIVHGNINDYVEHPSVNLTLREFVEQRMLRQHAVASFAPDQGITFPGGELVAAESRGWLDRVLGLDAAPQAAPGAFDPADALRRAAPGGQFGGGSDQQPLPSDAPGAIDLLLKWARGAARLDGAGQPLPTEQPRDKDGNPLPGPWVPARAVGPKGDRKVVPAKAGIVIERADLIVPPEDKARLSPADRSLLALVGRAGSDVQINRNLGLVLILAPSLEDVHPDLRVSTSGIRTIEVSMPDHDQRLRFITRVLADRNVQLDGLTEVGLASATAGLGRRHIEDIAMRAAAVGGRLTPSLVKARKDELIKSEYAEVLTVLDPDVSFEQVGGHQLVKEYLKRRVVTLLRDPAKRKRCPMGLLFAGPSGTGKTFLSRALGYEADINVVEMSPSNIRGSYVGESEKKLARAIQGIKALAPCILFIDEIDQKIRRTSGGGGGGDSVEGNIFGKLLEFLGDTSHRGSILLVCATNRPDQIDAAMKRPGRIDAKIPLLPPQGPEERAEALAALAIRHDVPTLAPEVWLSIGEQTDLFTQAELEGLIVQAASIVETDELPFEEALSEALEEVVPSTDDIKLHTDLAIAVCSNRKLVPERYRARVGKQLRTPAPAPAVAVGAARQAVPDVYDADVYDDEEV